MRETVAVTSTTNESLISWLALALTPGLGPTRGRRLVEQFGGAQSIFKASLTELEAAGIKACSAQSFATGRSMELAQDEKGRVAGVCFVGLEASWYPAQLKQVYDPPLILYVRGNVDVIAQPACAIVGTRPPTPYGLGMAERLACDLAARALVISAGAGRGCGRISRRGRRQETVAVLGTGVDVIYPKEHTCLTEQMLALGRRADRGILNTFAAPQNFPIAIASSVAFPSACWSWKLLNTAERASHRAVPWSRIAKFSPCLGTSPTRIPGDPTLSPSRAPSSPPAGKTFGSNSRQAYDLR
jgi:DNA processing protein